MNQHREMMEGMNTTQLLLVLCVIVILFLLVLLVVVYNSKSSSLASDSIIEAELDFDENAKENLFKNQLGNHEDGGSHK